MTANATRGGEVGPIAAHGETDRQALACGLGQAAPPAATADGGRRAVLGQGQVPDGGLGSRSRRADLGRSERKKATLDRFFAEYLPPRRRRAAKAVCVDMWRPFLESLREHLPSTAIVCQSPHLRAAMRGKRWLLLTRWHNLPRAKRSQLKQALALNRRLFKAYYLKEQIERLWTYTYEGAALRFLDEWVKSLRRQRLPAFQKLALTLLDHLDGILAYCRHRVPFGVVEAINGNLRALIRRGRGYQDHEYLVLKAQRSTAQARLAKAARRCRSIHESWHRPISSTRPSRSRPAFRPPTAGGCTS